jgi:hypothetical protein
LKAGVDRLLTVLPAALCHLSDGPATAEQGVDSQVCPSTPEAGAEETGDESGRFGPGCSSYEPIADFALHVRAHCVLARLVDWFGQYDRKARLGAAIWTRGGSVFGDAEYEVLGVRRTVEVDVHPCPLILGLRTEGHGRRCTLRAPASLQSPA